MDEKPRTFVAIILDRSGSMKYSREATITGFNQQVAKIRKESENSEVYVSFYTFNQVVEPHYRRMSVNFLLDITDEDYVCAGDTAMYEAVGSAITDLKDNTDCGDKSNSYLVIIVSDGMNNTIINWTKAKLAREIKSCQDSGQWTFTYLGANQDLSEVAEELNIPKGNVAKYSNDMSGTRVAWSTNTCQVGKYFQARASGQSQVVDFYGSDKQVTDLTDPLDPLKCLIRSADK